MSESEEPRSLGCAGCGDCCERIPVTAAQFDGAAYGPESRNGRDVAFIRAHWKPLDGDPGYSWCDAFDPVHRRCTVYEERPPVCRDYPWYFSEPGDGSRNMHPRCSYLLDVSPARRPEGARPLIPVEVVRR